MIILTKEKENASLITHAGKFHADDIFSTVLLHKLLGNVIVSRVNNIDFDTTGKIVYDIGFGEFDHHMKDFDKRHECGTKYASFGLLFDKYGKALLEKKGIEEIDETFEIIKNDLVFQIDAIDNGEFPTIDSPFSYKSIDGIINDFNPSYLEEEDLDEFFKNACEIIDSYFERVIIKSNAKAKAKKIIDKKIEECNSEIMVLETFMPFKEFILSSELDQAKNIQFVITPSNRGGYVVHTIPKDKTTYDLRCPLIEEWGGLQDDELEKVSGIEGAKFCHKSLFLGSAKTFEAALEMATKSLEQKREKDNIQVK